MKPRSGANPAQILELFEIFALRIKDAEDQLEEGLVEIEGKSRRPLKRQNVDEL